MPDENPVPDRNPVTDQEPASHEILHRVIEAARRRRRQRELVRGLSVGTAVGCGGALLAVLLDRLLQPGWPLPALIGGLRRRAAN